MKRRILLVGCDNFIGTRVDAALAASDWAMPTTWAPADGAMPLDGIDAVFNGTMGSPDAVLRCSRTLHAALGASSRIRVVHLSSMTVYGSYTGVADEAVPLRSDIGAYGAAQVTAESLAREISGSVILRPGCEYGPGCPAWSVRIARLLRSHRLGDLGARGDGICNLIYADDLAAAVLAALRTPDIDGQTFNLAMRSPPTWNEYFTAFARALGAVPVARIGSRRLKIETLIAVPLKLLEMLGGGTAPPPITPSLINACSHNIRLDSRRAESVLGCVWTPLDAGLRQTAAALNASRGTAR